jgi:hypothetical protein
VTHPEPEPAPEPAPGFSGVAAAGIAVLFLALRILYLYAREPFFDELYTSWMAGQPLSSIVPHLLHDSGPPLYYFLARLPSVLALRWVSLLFAAVTFVLVLRKWPLAAALLAVYPPAVFYATEARAYALCAMLVAMGVLLCHPERERGAWADGWRDAFAARARPLADARGDMWLAMFAFVLAAYAHYYGVLFFPLLLLKGRRGALAFLGACALFGPGFILAAHQPAEAMAWDVYRPYGVLIVSVALAALLARTWRFAPAVLVPVALVAAFALAGRNVYFPERFEAVLAVPLVLWAAVSLERWRPAMRYVFVALLMVAGIGVTARAIAEEMRQPTDSRVRAAMFVERLGAADVVASDYCYLVARTRLGPRVRAFPPSQGEHPGWYAPASMEVALSAARSLPANGFVFIGNAFTPELAAVRQVRRVQLQFRDGPAAVFRVEPAGLTGTLH